MNAKINEINLICKFFKKKKPPELIRRLQPKNPI